MKSFKVQGDVVIRPISSFPRGKRTKDKQTENNIFAYGEATGHVHQITEGEVETFKILNKLYINVISEHALLRHNTHKPVEIKKGKYEISIARETDYLTNITRKVVD